MGIVVIAAIMVEMISIVHYRRLEKIFLQEVDTRTVLILNSMSRGVEHMVQLTESTMGENLWALQRSLVDPDSVLAALVLLVDNNHVIDGGGLSFIPDYYPSIGRLFEPYASREDGKIVLDRLDITDGDDYTTDEVYLEVIESGAPKWSDPYYYAPDSLGYTSYSYPIRDGSGRLVAVCALDLDLSWLGDTLNVRQPYPSSYALLLTKDGKLVAAPSEERASEEDVEQVVDIVNGRLPESENPGLFIRKTVINRAPEWQLVQVYNKADIFAPMRRMRLQHMVFILLGLAILAFMIHRYARNESKLRKASQEQARIEGELEVAKRIQMDMLPRHFPPFIYGSLEPAMEVGGDLFDFYSRDGKLFFCIGDVSGKGVPSAMLMSEAHSLFRMASQKQDSPSKILGEMNMQLCQGNESCMFMTFFLGCLDLRSGVLDFSNAGHDKPFVLTDHIDMLDIKPNFPLGLFPDTVFEAQSCKFEPGNILFMYTDGLTEAINPENKEFGREGVTRVLESFLASGNDAPLSDLLSSMSAAAHGFAGTAPQSDDLTMMAIRFNPRDTLQEQ